MLVEEVEVGTEDSCVEQSLLYLRQILQVMHTGSCLYINENKAIAVTSLKLIGNYSHTHFPWELTKI